MKMKNWLAGLLVLAMLAAMAMPALAENMEIQLIGGPAVEAEPVSLDDVKLEVPIEVTDNFTLTATSYTVVDSFYAYKAGVHYVKYWKDHCDQFKSGNEAEYAMLRVDILNLQTRPVNYLDQVEVRVFSDDKYEFGGWAYQYDYDNTYNTDNMKELADANKEYVINTEDQFEISPMYTGHFVFGCTLPNSVIEGKTPLRMVVNFAGNELTYNIRK